MAYWRGRLDLAIPIKVWDALPLARKIAFRDEVKAMKSLAVKINEGKPNEEMTVRASYHICHHDEPGNTIPCSETEQEI